MAGARTINILCDYVTSSKMKDLSHKNFLSAVLWKIKESPLRAQSGRTSCFWHGSFPFYLLWLALPQSSLAPGVQTPLQVLAPRTLHSVLSPLEALFITSQTDQIPPGGLGRSSAFQREPLFNKAPHLVLKT